MSDPRIFKITPLPKPEKRPSRFSALLLWVIAAAGLVLSSLVMEPLAPALAKMNPQLMQLVVDAFYYLPFLALPLFLLAHRRPGLAEAYRPNPISLFNVISIAILALLGVFWVNDITVLWSIPFQKLGLDVYTASIPAPANTRELALAVITMAAIPAICEEFLFRGAMMSALERYGTRHAFLVTSLLFALLHGSITGLPAQFLLGIVLCLVVFWTDSIYAGLIYHTVHNAAAVILDYLQSRTPEAAAVSDDLLTAIGGAAGIVNLSLSILFSAALIYFTLKLLRLRGQLQGITTEPRRKERLRASEILLLVSGLMLCALLYGTTFFAMLGGGGA